MSQSGSLTNSSTATRNQDQYGEDLPAKGAGQLVSHVAVQHDRVAYLQLGGVVVRGHAGVPQEREQEQGGGLQRAPEPVVPVGGGYLQHGPFQVPALGAACRLPAFDSPVHGKQPAVACFVPAAPSF